MKDAGIDMLPMKFMEPEEQYWCICYKKTITKWKFLLKYMKNYSQIAEEPRFIPWTFLLWGKTSTDYINTLNSKPSKSHEFICPKIQSGSIAYK